MMSIRPRSGPGAGVLTYPTAPCTLAVLLLAGAAQPAPAQDHPVILQWFEQQWEHMEYRTPDFFKAGYGALWLPPPTKGASAGSAGYDVFNRFDLGSPGAATTYGTESGFRAAVKELQRANGLVYIDIIMNHNSGRNTSASFQAAGGYPGFWMAPDNPPQNKQPTDNWGDFHAGTAGGYYQSEDPNGPRYDLHRGDLVALIDIAQETNFQFIRHPVEEGHPQNIPAGTVHNRPDPNNRRFYPDTDLAPVQVVNPGTSRNPGQLSFTFFPFNTQDPMGGDPVTDNTTGLLMRWSQWMLDEFGVDGFRLDAAKHIPSWFWDRYWDSAVHGRWVGPDGVARTPFSFVESVEGNSYTYGNYVRKDAFANRDALDLNGAGQLRDLVNAAGFGSWLNVLNAHIDTTDDGFNNGTLGVNHVNSHDNGSAGDGGSQPPLPTRRNQAFPQHAYLLTRPGPAIVYHNARGVTRPGGFWPREGSPLALGLDPASNTLDATLTRLVGIRNMAARGEFNVRSVDGDVMVFERRKNLGGGSYSSNLLVGVNDRYDSGVQTRTVQTSFPPGTRLHELTGNAEDPSIDPSGQIPAVLTTGANGTVTIVVPNNVSAAGEHAKGYVAYAPALPTAALTITNQSGVIPADPPSTPAFRRRLHDVPVVSSDTFQLEVTTTQTDPLDPNTDDNAVFRFNRGYEDLNGNGTVDITTGAMAGYEQFLTTNQPLYGSGSAQGLYRQTIDATRLPEGYNYLSVAVFRHRDASEDPLFRELREVVYIDRVGPEVELIDAGAVVTSSTHQFRVRPLDRTANRVHLLWDVPDGQDPLSLIDVFNLASKHDRFEWRKTLVGLTHGHHTLTIVAFEPSGNTSITNAPVFVNLCPADFNGDGSLNVQDFTDFRAAYLAGDLRADFSGNGTLDVADFTTFRAAYLAGCP